MRGNLKYMLPLVIVLIIAIYADAASPKPIDWSESYSRYRKSPYGAYALYELLVEAQSESHFRTVDEAIYSVLATDDTSAAYVLVNNSFEPDEYDLDALLTFVDYGFVAFIAARYLGEDLQDSLGIATDNESFIGFDRQGSAPGAYALRDTLRMNFASKVLRAPSDYPVRVGTGGACWIDTLDSATTTVLGVDDRLRPNFVRIARGEGAIYLSTTPLAFTNLNVLSGRNAEYALGALSYLPVGPIVWDEHYKAGRRVNRSTLRYFMSDEALRWVTILAIVGGMLFMLVYARRRQRAIPVIPPPRNTTLLFAETVGRLYFQHGDHRGIARKKVSYFHEYLRTHLGLTLADIEADPYRRVAERSGVSEDRIRTIFGRIQYMQRAFEFDEDDLKSLNADLEHFYSNSKR